MVYLVMYYAKRSYIYNFHIFLGLFWRLIIDAAVAPLHILMMCNFNFRYGVSTQDEAFKAELCDLYAR